MTPYGGLQEDISAAATEVEKYLVNGPEIVDPSIEAVTIAQIAVLAARPRMWVRLQQENAQLKQALNDVLVSGCCPKCGQLLT